MYHFIPRKERSNNRPNPRVSLRAAPLKPGTDFSLVDARRSGSRQRRRDRERRESERERERGREREREREAGKHLNVFLCQRKTSDHFGKLMGIQRKKRKKRKKHDRCENGKEIGTTH
ncbi:uncharacterized protein [Trachinotus anak]|uniref:uncharacterized protein n=1 Tax=Trachinotus anak TaxID=443729 RepID=UPI0039F19A70